MRGVKIRQMLSMSMAMMLAAGVLAGCMTGSKGKGTDISGSDEDRKERLTGEEKRISDSTDSSDIALGRYAEREIGIPQGTEEDSLVAFFWGQEDTLELYTAAMEETGERKGARRFLWKDESWQEDEGWWERVKPSEPAVTVQNVFYGLDGNYYFSAMSAEGDYIYHLYRIGPNGSGAGDGSMELMPEVFAPDRQKSYGMIPPKAEAGADGNILLHGFGEAIWYRPDGERIFAMEKSWGGMSEFSTGYLTEEEFVTRTDRGVTRYRLADGLEIETIPCAYDADSGNGDEGMVLFGDGKGGIYSADEHGLAHVNAGGSLWELVIDGSLSTLGMRSVFLREFLAGDDEDYYGAFSKNGGRGFLLYHYVYDAEMSAMPPVKLTVYGLRDNSTVRQAAALFQQTHPEVRVEILNGADADGNISEDMIRALNTELLGGTGADVLILDDLPVKSYQEKGILLDIRDIFIRLQTESPMMEQVLENFTEKDGAIYQMPARITMPLAIGGEPALRALAGLDEMIDYQDPVPLLAVANYENLLREVANLQYPQLFGSGKMDLPETTGKQYLETVRLLGEKNGAKSMFTEEEMERLATSNHVVQTGILGSATVFDQNLSGCGIEELRGLYDAMILLAVRKKHPEASLTTVKRLYFPRVLSGVNQATKHPELAKEFVASLFSTEVQQEEFMDGFPVNLAAQQLICERENENFSIGMGYGDYHISANWPDRQEREEIYGLLRTVETPVRIDEIVMRMIVDGAGNYLNGKETVEQAVHAIRSRISLYRAEQE
ncbi:MAG: hypothetical protein HFG55_10450 [Lachnospiraceae bacterium]|nr:hypothetical protein [Lachnospiraceae bacterium]